MKLMGYLKNKHLCFKIGHLWKFDGYTLGGDWIRCERCKKLDEYLPGVHEPKGYIHRVDLTWEVQ